MNRSFLIIFIPALLVAGGYLYLGYHFPTRAEIGLAVLVAAIAAFRLKAMLRGRKSVAPTGQAPPARPLPEEPAAPHPS